MWDYLIHCSVDERPLFMFLYCRYLQRGLPATFTIESTMGYGCFFPFLVAVNISTTIAFTSDILLSLESIHDLLMPKSKSFFSFLNTSWHVGTTSINNSNLLTFPYLLRWRFLVNPFYF